MSKWQYKLLIKNTLDRDLKLDSIRIPYGKEDTISKNIPANGEGVCTIYSPKGKAYGIEFFVTYSDIYTKEQNPYGSFTVYVDIPYWKHKNSSNCSTTGILEVEGFQEVPDGNHDFENSIIVTTKL